MGILTPKTRNGIFSSESIFTVLLALVTVFACEVEEPIPTYTLTTSVTPSEGGKIVVSPQVPNYQEGTQVILTPEPKENWVFKQWEGDATGSISPLPITMSANKAITGVFIKRDYPLNIKIEGEGTVDEKIIPNPSGREYPHGSTIELTPKPKEGWGFIGWEGDLTGKEIPKRITVDKQKNVTAKFKILPVFKLSDNGVTCLCENVKAGDKGLINGVEYEAVDNALLKIRRNQEVDLTKLCTSLVTDMSSLFEFSSFNQSIGNWDVSNVENMYRMFYMNSNFNQSIENWDVSNVKNMSEMFFCECVGSNSFNQPLGNWNVSKVTNMSGMFALSKFNQPIGNWDVKNVENMAGMFNMNSKFNQSIGNWDVSNVTDMSEMFESSKFNQPIGNWNVSKVTNMAGMFQNSPFNQIIENWNVSKVTNMSGMFAQTNFNQQLEKWNVTNVTNMYRMFLNSPFNQPLGSWNVRNVTNMTAMFQYSPFNQNISNWCVPKITSEPPYFSTYYPISNESALSLENRPKWGSCPD
jgi:uncharacterized repeat protein (TIGR02543 family)